MTAIKLLTKLGATISMSEGRRCVAMGAVKLNGFSITRFDVEHEFHIGDVIEVGRRKFEIKQEHLE